MAALAKKPFAEITHNLVGQRLGRKGQDTRDRIVAAMDRLLQAHEDAAITLSAVAREASIGMSTLYLYFPDLGELALAVLARTIKDTDPAFIQYLDEFWPDDTLTEHIAAFTMAHFTFWEKHARLLRLHHAFADARDPRFVRFREKMATPARAMLVRQMRGRAEDGTSAYEDCALVLLMGLERVASSVMNPDFATRTGIEEPEERRRYIDRMALAETTLMEALIRAMRQRGVMTAQA